MDELSFIDVNVNGDLLDHLRRGGVIGGYTSTFLKLAFSHGGYIAGGFGMRLFRSLNPKKGSANVDVTNINKGDLDSLHYYFGSPSTCNDSWKSVSCGDVDVWFPSYQALSAFYDDPDFKQIRSRSRSQFGNQYIDRLTVTGIAREFVFGGEDVRIQVISSYLRPKEQQISRFDIYNAMCAFDGQKLTYPENMHFLEERQMLHVHNWGTQNSLTVNRVFKYLGHRHGYKILSPKSADELITMLLEALETIENNRSSQSRETTILDVEEIQGSPSMTDAQGEKRRDPFMVKAKKSSSNSAVMKAINGIIPGLSNEKLVELSAIMGNNKCDEEGYLNMAQQTLFERMKNDLRKINHSLI